MNLNFSIPYFAKPRSLLVNSSRHIPIIHSLNALTCNCYYSVVADTPYMSDDGGSPRPVDPNAMDVDSVNSPPAVSSHGGTVHIEFVIKVWMCK